MKKALVLTAMLALFVLPSCQSKKVTGRLNDQNEQLAAMQSERQRLLTERDRVRAENAEYQERLSSELSRNSELRNRVSAMEAAQAAKDSEVESLRSTLAGTGVGVNRRGGLLVLDLPQSITFASGKAELSAKGRESLTAVGAALRSAYADSTFWVEGHTDNDPIKKSAWRSNLQLSLERALSVAEYLMNEQGLPPENVRVAGHGPNMPKVPNDSAQGKAENRRVEILILEQS
ncbi:MAG TPA: OmpA family protein [Planctomycetota bacterium]